MSTLIGGVVRSDDAGTRRTIAFPLLKDAATYRARTFDYLSVAGEGCPLGPQSSYRTWVEMFRSSIASFKRQAAHDGSVADAEGKAEAFASKYDSILYALAADPWAEIPGHGVAEIDCVRLCKLREACLREAGFLDIFHKVKFEENAKALQLLPSVLRELDSQTNHALQLGKALRGVFAGNVFDLGAAASAKLFEDGRSSFFSTRDSLMQRPWVVDDYNEIVARLSANRYKKALLFVDNAGSDVVLGILPFARELIRRGTAAVLAANSIPSINDITAGELQGILMQAAAIDKTLSRAIAEELLVVVNTGNDLPVIDLNDVSEALARACEGVDLVVLEGMGRAIETNLNAQLTCDKLNLGMIKHPEVATVLGGRLYDCVCKFTPATTQ